MEYINLHYCGGDKEPTCIWLLEDVGLLHHLHGIHIPCAFLTHNLNLHKERCHKASPSCCRIQCSKVTFAQLRIAVSLPQLQVSYWSARRGGCSNKCLACCCRKSLRLLSNGSLSYGGTLYCRHCTAGQLN